MVEFLIQNGANQNLSNKDGETPLNVAEKKSSFYGSENYKKIVQMLKSN